MAPSRFSMLAKAGLLCLATLFVLYSSFNHQGRTETTALRVSPSSSYADIHDVQNTTLGFSKIFVLNMPDRYDRVDLWSLAARYSNITFEYFDGVSDAGIPAKARPAGWDDSRVVNTLGCLRSHMNMMSKIVEQRIETALIFENDADWDVMLKRQLVEFARGARYIQGLDDTSKASSPYGDDWDILWIGHCGVRNDPKSDQRYWLVENDPTVAPRSTWGYRSRSPKTTPPALDHDFTRMVFEPKYGLCTASYAISLRGAERMLLHWSVRPEEPGTQPIDDDLRIFCDTKMSNSRCIAPFPPLVEQYKAVGSKAADSDREYISSSGLRWKPRTQTIVFPLRPNLDRLVDGVPMIPSQYGENSLWNEINPLTAELPPGHPVFISKDEFAS